MPAVGFGIGAIVRAEWGIRSAWLPIFAGVLAYISAMLTHFPSSYDMFRSDFGAPPVRSAILAIIDSLKYPLEVSARFSFYGLMLVLSIVGSMWASFSK
jgi:hypothetical protein